MELKILMFNIDEIFRGRVVDNKGIIMVMIDDVFILFYRCCDEYILLLI